MLIREFCQVTGLGRDTVRFYVKRGLLKPTIGSAPKGEAPSNRYQVFDDAQVERAKIIRTAPGLGFTLAEIAKLAAAYDQGAMSLHRKVELLQSHLAAIDEKVLRLNAMRDYLNKKLRWVSAGERGVAPQFRADDEPVSGARKRRAVPRRFASG